MPKISKVSSKKLGNVHMIDVGDKAVTERVAKARAVVSLSSSTLSKIEKGEIPKGDVLSVARVAGIQGAKETSRMLPLCHPLPLEAVELEFFLRHNPTEIEIHATAKANWKTGVEMEALCSVTAAALTIYDMCKAIEKGITIHGIQLLEKRGGRSGTWIRS